MQNKIVVRYADGRVLKGSTADFSPAKPTFHLVPATESGPSADVLEIKLADLTFHEVGSLSSLVRLRASTMFKTHFHRAWPERTPREMNRVRKASRLDC